MATAREKLVEVRDMLVAAQSTLKPWIKDRKGQIASAEVELRERENRLRAVEAGIVQIDQLLSFLPDE